MAQHNLRKLRLARGWRLEDAAAAFSMSAKGYEKIEYDTRKLSLKRIRQAAEIYCVSPAEILDPAENVPIQGLVDHGAVVTYFSPPNNLGFAPRSPDGSSESVVLLVNKGVMVPGVALEDYFIYHEKRNEGVAEECIGKLCVLEDATGRTVIRQIHAGRTVGRYDLVAIGGQTERDVEVRWSARITWVKPT